ncbi:MAG TPA: SIS domain-containing protein [Roseiflexaceae bacterium]|nr:SIS domain-containing protein [Roseiflexaceae bacterium]
MATDILDDILAQPRLLAEAAASHLSPGSALVRAAAALAAHRPRRVLLAGMGSSFFACYPAVLRLQAAGYAAALVELSELLHFGGPLDADTLLVLVSQSGETVEARRLLEERPPAGPLIAVTNTPGSTLARAATCVVETLAGDERTVATRTYTTALLALALLAELALGADPLALTTKLAPTIEAAGHACAEGVVWAERLPAEWLAPGPLTLVARGLSLASALSGALALKETAKVPAEGLSTAQFRHGPIEIAAPGHRAIVVAGPGRTLALDLAMAAELRAVGSRTLLVGPASADAADEVFALPAVWLSPLVEIVPLQLLARQMALRQGFEPGSFRYITKVTARE